MSRPLVLQPGRADDLTAVRRWLTAAGLPDADLGAVHMGDFLVARHGQHAVGAIGIERFGSVGLLRSLVVAPDARRQGLGARLVAALEAAALDRGVTELWLLTIDAQAYFARLGYAVATRDAAPAAIRRSAEFAELCPDDAVLMRRRLR